MMLVVVAFLFLVSSASAQNVTIAPSPLIGAEGSNLTVDCSLVGGGRRDFELLVSGSRITTLDKFAGALVTPTGTQFIYGPLNRSEAGIFFECDDSAGNRASATLVVNYPPTYSVLPSQPTTALDGVGFTYSFGFEAFPAPTNFTWSRDGQVISSNDAQIATSVSTITITNTTRSDSGVYEVVSYNEAGRGAANFTLDVQYPPEYNNTAQVQHTQLVVGARFTLNCTPSDANPSSTVSIAINGSLVTTGDTVSVTDNVLTIPSVQRNHSGNYSCTATNTRGSAVIYSNLLVVGPPTAPRAVALSEVGPFTANLTWTAPEDDGGVSDPSWDPALDSRENRPYLTYTVTLTNGTVTTMATTQSLSLPLSTLQHSTAYTVTVEAGNVYGRGPQGTTPFNTTDSVPIIDSVEVLVLSLFEVEVNISLLTNGGQSVTQYKVEVNGTNYTFPGSEQMQVSLLLDQLSVNLTKGERVTLRAFAVNSVGTSDPVSVDMIVPSPPNITAPPTELAPANIPVCCVGVQLNLANPEDQSIQVQVHVDSTLHPANQVARNGSFLYIMGLQAGTEYSLNIALSNIFGTEWINTAVRPLLGHPSTPQVTLTPTAGGLTVQLTAMYPGTREDTLQYSISTPASPRSRRQTGQQTLPVTNLTTPVSGSAEVALGPGTYSVTVTVTNQHGSTTSEPQQVTIPDPPASTDTTVIIGVVVAVVIVILLLILAVFIIVLVYMKFRYTKGEYKPKKEPVNGDEDKEMMDIHSSEPLAAQYEDPDTLNRKPRPDAVYKKEEEAAKVQPNTTSGVVYADLDFSRQALAANKKVEKKPAEEVDAVVYSEVRPITPQEKQQLKEQEVAGGDGEEPQPPTTII